MQFKETGFPDLIEIIPQIHHDHRGYFLETYHLQKILKGKIDKVFIQDNESFSLKNVLRGLHYQKFPNEQAKIVQVFTGKVLDVVVDMRTSSPKFGQHYSCILDGERNNMLYVPEGFAHGFLALEDTYFFYKCSAFHNKETESGIIWNDPKLNIDWGIDAPIISEKDQYLPGFDDAVKEL